MKGKNASQKQIEFELFGPYSVWRDIVAKVFSLIPIKLQKTVPYMFCLVAGIICFLLSYHLASSDITVRGLFSSLSVNLAATFISIPTLFLIYEWTKKKIDLTLNEELFKFVKLQIDTDLFIILNRVNRLISPYTDDGRSGFLIREYPILNLDVSGIQERLKKNNLLGFQIFSPWSLHEDRIQSILQNVFILQRLDGNHLKALLRLSRFLHEMDDYYIERLLIRDCIFTATGKDGCKHFKVERKSNDNNLMAEYALYLEAKNYKIRMDERVFYIKDSSRLLNYYRIDESHIPHFSTMIFNVLNAISEWKRVSGNTPLMMDTRILLDELTHFAPDIEER